MDNENKVKDDTWSKGVHKAVNIVVVIALVSTVFGVFATYGALMMIQIFY